MEQRCRTNKWLRVALAAAIAFASGSSARAQAQAQRSSGERCELGRYDLEEGDWFILYGARTAGHLRYARADGETGELDAADGAFVERPPRPPATYRVLDCAAGVASVTANGVERTARRQSTVSRSVRFRSGDIELAGRLVLPASGRADTIVVWVTGSDQVADINDIAWQYILPAQNVGIFVFDKRGTGASGGAPTANFPLRAADVRAAVRQVRTLVGPRPRVGLFGVSQGGWVAPLAALTTRVNFVIVGYGMAQGVTAEDRDEIVQNLRAAGFGDAEVARALRLQAAASRVVISHWQSGWEEFDAIRREYAAEPWMRALGTDGYTGLMVQAPSEQLRQMGPRMDLGISFEYDPLPTLRRLRIPQLWILGGADTSAPSEQTRIILTDLQHGGARIDLVVFPQADHGIVERETSQGVEHVRASAGYWDLVAAWAATGRIPNLSGASVQPHRNRVQRSR